MTTDDGNHSGEKPTSGNVHDHALDHVAGVRGSVGERRNGVSVEPLVRRLAQYYVIPELAKANRDTDFSADVAAQSSDATREALRHRLLGDDFDGSLQIASSCVAATSFVNLCQAVLTPIARDFGQQWERDELSFVEVTTALCHMHRLVNLLAPQTVRLRTTGADADIVLAKAGGEQHALGLLIVSKMFAFEGWRVSGGSFCQTGDDLDRLVGERWFDVIGLSASTTQSVVALETEIRSLREASSNPAIFVLVGGAIFAEDPELYRVVGADSAASDATQAVSKVRMFLDSR
ncbi:MAG: cobalamin B12-binding domain-containing protein [Pseudomonadota bacterium]